MSHLKAAPFGANWKQPFRFTALALTLAVANAEPTFYDTRVAPILEQHCVTCHGAEKAKAKLRLDSFEHLKHGSENGEIVLDGNIDDSELFYRIGLPETHEDVMPSDGKPLLSAAEIKVIELWIKAGASPTAAVSAFPDAPAPKRKPGPVVPLADDWQPLATQIRALEKELGVKLAPRSLVPTDGLVLRTASAPSRCDDAALAKLDPIAAYIVEAELARTKVTDAGLGAIARWENLRSLVPTDGLVLRTASAPSRCDDAALAKLDPVAAFIVEAELARTKVTDAGLEAIARWENLRSLDLTRTAVTSRGVAELVSLKKLERLNLTSTAVDDAGLQTLREIPSLQRLWVFESKVADANGALLDDNKAAAN